MFPRKWLVLAVVVVALPSLAGCNLKDWWDINGTFRVEVSTGNNANSRIGDFQSLKLGIYDLSLKQEGEVNPALFAFRDEPLVIDMVRMGREGGTMPVIETVRSLRPVTAVTIRVSVIEAIDATGKSLPACFPNQPVESRPCVSTPLNGAYRIDDQPFSPPRGGSATFVFPILVKYAANVNEYFISTDSTLVKVTTEK